MLFRLPCEAMTQILPFTGRYGAGATQWSLLLRVMQLRCVFILNHSTQPAKLLWSNANNAETTNDAYLLQVCCGISCGALVLIGTILGVAAASQPPGFCSESISPWVIVAVCALCLACFVAGTVHLLERRDLLVKLSFPVYLFTAVWNVLGWAWWRKSDTQQCNPAVTWAMFALLLLLPLLALSAVAWVVFERWVQGLPLHLLPITQRLFRLQHSPVKPAQCRTDSTAAPTKAQTPPASSIQATSKHQLPVQAAAAPSVGLLPHVQRGCGEGLPAGAAWSKAGAATAQAKHTRLIEEV